MRIFGKDDGVRIASWNVNGISARTPSVMRWLLERQPDVLGIQELRSSKQSPMRRFADLGFHVAHTDHVALVSIDPIEDVTEPTGDGRTIGGTIDGVRVINTYAPNGVKAKTPRHTEKVEWLTNFSAIVADEAARATDLALLGDFNVALAPSDVWAPHNYRGRNLFTTAEREALQSVIDRNGLNDVLRTHHPGAGLYTWWNYAHTAFERNRGWRLDYIFANAYLADRVEHAVVDVQERGRERASDHAPLWIDVS